MDDAQSGDAGLVDALEASYPQLEVGIDWVLHQYGHVAALQGVGDFLHGEGVGHGAGTDPEEVDTGIQGGLDVGVGSYFGAYLHAEFLLHTVEPGQTFFADAFEAAGFRAGLPDAGAEELDALAGELRGGVHHLFFGLGGAGAGNDDGAFHLGLGAKEIKGRKIEVHSIGIIVCPVIILQRPP